MSKIDQKYIDALSQFTDALDQIVDTLKGQQKNKKSDVVNDFLKTPMDNLVTVVSDLKKVTEKGFTQIHSDNKEILKKIESIKQQKESGMFDRIEDPKNKNKIVDGIKIVALIAGGVLALGLAFKIIGKVDFLSVIALSTAMLLISNTFSKIADIKNVTYGQIFKISILLPLMASGIMLSGMILRGFPSFTIGQSISMLLIGGTLGITSYLLLKAISNIPLKSLLFVPLLPLIIPLIALSLVKASSILSGIQSLSFRQVAAVTMIGLSIGVAMIAIGFALKVMKNVTWKELIMLSLAVPLISLSIVTASGIFQDMKIIKDPIGTVVSSLIMGLSILAFAPAVYILGKMKFTDIVQGLLAVALFPSVIASVSKDFSDIQILSNPLNILLSSFAMGLSILAFAPAVYILGKMSLKDMLLGALAIPIISAAIVATAAIFSLLPTKMIYPDLMWTLGAGLSILTFGGMAVGLGLIFTATGGLAALGMAGALLAILAVAGTIVATSYILGKGDYSLYPPLSWALGVGGSLVAFSVAAVAASVAGVASLIGTLFTGGKDPLVKMAESMTNVAKKLSEYNWSTTKYPSYGWSLGVGTAITLFASAYAAIMAIEGVGRVFSFITGGKSKDFNTFIISAATSMKTANIILAGVSWNTSYPSKEYADGVGGLLLSMAKTYAIVTAIDNISSVFSFLTGGNGKDFNTFVVDAALSMKTANEKLAGVNWNTKYPSKDYAEGVGTLLVSMAEAYSKVNDMGFFDLIGQIFTKKQSFPKFVEEASQTITSASKILSGGNFTTKINRQWVDGFTYFVISIADLVDKSDFNNKKISNFTISSNALQPMISSWINTISQGDYSKYPSIKYTSSIIYFLSEMNDLALRLKSVPDNTNKNFNEFLNNIKNLVNTPELDTKAASLNKLAMSFSTLADSLAKVNSNLENFKTLSRNLPLIGIDNKKLSVDNYKEDLKIVNEVQSEQSNLLTKIKDILNTPINVDINQNDSNKKIDTDEKELQKQFYQDISDIRLLLYQFKDHIDKPSQTGSFYK